MDFADKIVSFIPVEKRFKDDNGQNVDYTVFELTYKVNGNNKTMDFKTRSPEDKTSLLELADTVAE